MNNLKQLGTYTVLYLDAFNDAICTAATGYGEGTSGTYSLMLYLAGYLNSGQTRLTQCPNVTDIPEGISELELLTVHCYPAKLPSSLFLLCILAFPFFATKKARPKKGRA